MKIELRPFGKTQQGVEIQKIVMANSRGLEAAVLTIGATLYSVLSPDREGNRDELTLGFDTLERYLDDHPFFGSTVGRFANRIDGAQFVVDGRKVQLKRNEGHTHIHGGKKGFHTVVWTPELFETRDEAGVRLRYRSVDGEENYPGNLDVVVTYVLTEDDRLKILYEAKTDQTTPVNLTNHAYWNLDGAGKGSVLGHELKLEADEYLETNPKLIPTGRLLPVQGTPYDFTSPKRVGQDIATLPIGYDSCFVLRRTDRTPAPAADLYSPETGRGMRIFTDQPGIQLYSAFHLSGVDGRSSARFGKFGGICLETQNFPDAPNHPAFPDSFLRPGEIYTRETIHEFYVLQR